MKRQDRWQAGTMETNYLTSLFWRAIRAINGFPVDGDQFFLERAVVTPSLSLQQKVFPSADCWLKRVEDDGDICPDAICAQGFLRLINNLRVSPQLVF